MNQKVETKNASASIGSYSQAICSRDTLYMSGQFGLDPATV